MFFFVSRFLEAHPRPKTSNSVDVTRPLAPQMATAAQRRSRPWRRGRSRSVRFGIHQPQRGLSGLLGHHRAPLQGSSMLRAPWKEWMFGSGMFGSYGGTS